MAPIFIQLNAIVEIIAPMAEKHRNLRVCANGNDERNEFVEIADQKTPKFPQNPIGIAKNLVVATWRRN